MMRKVLIRNLFSFLFAIGAMVIIVLNLSGLGWANLVLGLNPVLKLSFQNYYFWIVNQELQLSETSSFYIHYNGLAYLVHLISVMLVGAFVDLLKNKRIVNL